MHVNVETQMSYTAS